MGPELSTMPVSGMCMLRRFFPLLATIASCLSESSRQAGNKAFNCGYGVRPESVKTSLIDFSLARSIGESYGFGGFGVAPEVFRAESDLKMWFGCIAHDLKHYSG